MTADEFREFDHRLSELEVLNGKPLRIELISRGYRYPGKIVSLGMSVEIADGAFLTGVAASAGSVEDAVRILWERLTMLPADRWIVRERGQQDRQAFRYDHAFGSWVRFDEARRARVAR